MMKSKIVFEQTEPLVGLNKYVVTSLTNRTTPRIGEELTEPQVKKLLADGRGNLTIDIKPKKKV